MAWTLKGRYVATCSCTNVCPCSTASAPPDNPDGSTVCWGLAVFDVAEGNMDAVDLSGIQVGMYVSYPGLVSDGSWRLGIALDPSVSEEQAAAVETIISGKAGGPFGDMAGLVSEWTGVERTSVSVSDGMASIGGHSYTYEPLRGQDGSPTMISNAVFGFAPSFEIGAATGQLEAFGHPFPASYGEAAEFVYSSETHEHIRA
jgi:hypothetical protein